MASVGWKKRVEKKSKFLSFSILKITSSPSEEACTHSTELWRTFCSWLQLQKFSNRLHLLEARRVQKVLILKILTCHFHHGTNPLVVFHLSKGDPSSGSAACGRESENHIISFGIINTMETDKHKNLCLSLYDDSTFVVPIPHTVFRLRGARWQVWMMMCWKTIKWRRGMTKLWLQKQKEDSVCVTYSLPLRILHKLRRKREVKNHSWRRRVKVTRMTPCVLESHLVFISHFPLAQKKN